MNTYTSTQILAEGSLELFQLFKDDHMLMIIFVVPIVFLIIFLRHIEKRQENFIKDESETLRLFFNDTIERIDRENKEKISDLRKIYEEKIGDLKKFHEEKIGRAHV